MLPELAPANKGSALADQCLQPGDRFGPSELSQSLAAHCVIHCNIKPSTILVDEAGQMVLASDPINSPVAGAER